MKKRPHFLIGVIGLSTSHLHVSLLYSFGEPAAMSLVIEPEIKAEDLLEEVIKAESKRSIQFEFEARNYYKECNDFPPCVIKTKDFGYENNLRPPKSIKPTIKPRRQHQNNRRR